MQYIINKNISLFIGLLINPNVKENIYLDMSLLKGQKTAVMTFIHVKYITI